jgi:hypothetical protein
LEQALKNRYVRAGSRKLTLVPIGGTMAANAGQDEWLRGTSARQKW